MIVIIGAGISGLALAHHFAASSVPHVVLEATDRPGGVIRSAVVEGHLLEWGPQRTRLVGAMRKLIAEAGILDDVILAPDDLPLLVYRNGRLREVPRSFGDLFNTDLISTRGKLRLLREPFTSGERANETVADYFIRKIGYETYANMVGPLYGGLYASDPADMLVGLSLTHALREMGVKRSMIMRAVRRGGKLRVPPACSFRDGMETLPRALYGLQQSNVRLNTRVLGLSSAPRGIDVHMNGETISATNVVITTDAHAAANMLNECAIDASRIISRLHYNPLAIVHLHTTDTITRALGYQVGFDENLFTRGVTFNDALFERRGVYTSYLGGARHPEVLDWADERIAETAIAEFKTATGARARAISVARTAMPAWDRTWSGLKDMRVPAGIHFCTNWESRPGLPGRLSRAAALATALTEAPTIGASRVAE